MQSSFSMAPGRLYYIPSGTAALYQDPCRLRASRVQRFCKQVGAVVFRCSARGFFLKLEYCAGSNRTLRNTRVSHTHRTLVIKLLTRRH